MHFYNSAHIDAQLNNRQNDPTTNVYRTQGNFRTSNIYITAQQNISNSFIFEFLTCPPHEKLYQMLVHLRLTNVLRTISKLATQGLQP